MKRLLVSTNRDSGAVLLVILVMLVILSMVGVSAIRGTNLQEVMASNMRDSQVSFQAAEAGLRLGEAALSQLDPPAIDAEVGMVSVMEGAGAAKFWKEYDWDDSVENDVDLKVEADDPRFVLEQLDIAYVPGSDGRGVDVKSLETAPEIVVYRVTSRGVGMTENSITILQSVFRRQ